RSLPASASWQRRGSLSGPRWPGGCPPRVARCSPGTEEALMRVLPPIRRRRAEQQMTTQVEIVRPGDMDDPVTGEPVTTPLYEGKAKLTSYEGHESASL